MALDPDTITQIRDHGAAANNPVFFDTISFDGDAAYASGGSADFSGFISEKLASTRQVLGVVPLNCGATYVPFYDATTDKLLLRGWAGTEAADGDYSATTFQVLVISR